MTKKREPDARDENAPAVAVEDATERHIVKARELLREAQSRFSSRDDGAIDSKRIEQTSGDDGEGSDG